MARAPLMGLIGVSLLWSACSGGDDGGGRVDGGVGPRAPAEGQLDLVESEGPGDGLRGSQVAASIHDPRPRYHRMEQEAGACRMWSWNQTSCEGCDGLCNADGDCVPFPEELSAGTVTVQIDGQQRLVLHHSDTGYRPDAPPDDEIFDAGDRVEASAAGGPDVGAFELATTAVNPIPIELERDPNGSDKLEMTNGADLTLRWSPSVPGTRVRLEIPSNNRGHGLPVDALIECEADDTGAISVPRAMVEAFPERPYGDICAGSDCPPGTLTRFRADRVEIGGRAIELFVGAQRQFVPVKSR